MNGGSQLLHNKWEPRLSDDSPAAAPWAPSQLPICIQARQFEEHHSQHKWSGIQKALMCTYSLLLWIFQSMRTRTQNQKNATMQESKGKALVQIKIAPSTSHCFSQQQRGHITPLMDQNKECIASSLATSKK